MADKAILLGINAYNSVSGLRGCKNDVGAMREVLTSVFGFDDSNVKVLLDGEVTKTRIKQHMRWIFQDTKPGDRLLFHFSGHGSYTADQNDDEADGRDELICLCDMDFSNKNSYFIDDELGDWVRKLPRDRQLVVVLDSCHSGTGTRKIVPPESNRPMSQHPAIITRSTELRSAARGRSRSLTDLTASIEAENDRDVVIARFVEPPLEIKQAVEGARRRGILRREIVPELNHVLLTACRDDQTAADAYIDGQYHGAFTYSLCKILGAAGGEALSRRDLIARLSADLAAGRFDQVPQLEASTDERPLFATDKPTDSAAVRPMPGPSPSVEPPHDGPKPSAPATSAGGPTAPGAVGAGASELPQRMEEFLAAYNRVLAAGGALMGAGTGAAPVVPSRSPIAQGRKVLVYVHGICLHESGYSNDWWSALSPYAPELRPGDLSEPGSTNGQRYEVLWSDLVRGGARGFEAPEETSDRALRERETSQRLIEVLEDRARQQTVALAASQPDRPGAERALEAASSDRALLGIPGLDCINDFVQYLEKPTIRQQVQGRFMKVVSPLLRSGAQVEIISHSWGTVVAYESLGIMESAASLFSGSVANLFTVGSALSIGYVKNRLIDAVRDGHRPRMVRNWVNLDARGDIVGGPLKGMSFDVDDERLNLEPVGCNLSFPSPACAHSSYFNCDNVVTNRDIFGHYISAGGTT